MIVLLPIFAYFGLTISGMTFLILGNTYSEIFHGELIRSEVYSDTNCNTHCDSGGKNCNTNCDDTYYVDQIFLKRPDGNSTSTCTVRRLTPYYFKGDADNFVSRSKMGTRRTIFETLHSHGTCYDKKIRRTYNILGGILLAFPNSIILVIILIAGICKAKEWLEQVKRENQNKSILQMFERV